MMAYLNFLRKTACLYALLVSPLCLNASSAEAAAPQMKLSGDLQVEIVYNDKTAKLDVDAPTWKVVIDEEYESLPVYNKRCSVGRGRVLRGVNACECSVLERSNRSLWLLN